jgi:hypothetical protein
MWATSVTKKLPKVGKLPPNGLKFTQSGHSVARIPSHRNFGLLFPDSVSWRNSAIPIGKTYLIFSFFKKMFLGWHLFFFYQHNNNAK